MSSSSPRPGAALVPVLVAITMVVAIVSSLGAPLLPAVAAELDVGLDAAQWSLTVALLAGALAAPIVGRLGDGPYRREAILGGLAVVVAGSVIAGAAASLGVLIVGRAMQGVGLGLAPIAMAAARDHLPPDRSPGVIAVLSVGAAAGVGLGYPLSGLIAEVISVDAAFYFGGVIAGIALVAAFAAIPSSRASSRVPLDLRGAIVLSAALIALLLAIGQGESWGWGSPVVLGLFAAAALIGALWVVLSLRRPAPLVDLRQLRHRAVLTADLAAIVLGLSLYMILTVMTTFVQAPPEVGYGFGVSVIVAGCTLLPFSVLGPLTSRFVEPLMVRFGVRAVLVGGALIIAAGAAFFALVHDALWVPFVVMAMLGVGFGLTFAAIPGLIARAVPAEETGSAMGFYQVIRSIGFSIGSALTAAVLAAHTAPGSRHPDVAGYTTAMWIAAAVCLGAALMAAVLSRGGLPGPETIPDAELAAAGLPDAAIGRAGRP